MRASGLLVITTLMLRTLCAKAYEARGYTDTSNGFCVGDYGIIPVDDTGYDDERCERILCSEGMYTIQGCGVVGIANMPSSCKLVGKPGHYPNCCKTNVKCDNESEDSNDNKEDSNDINAEDSKGNNEEYFNNNEDCNDNNEEDSNDNDADCNDSNEKDSNDNNDEDSKGNNEEYFNDEDCNDSNDEDSNDNNDEDSTENTMKKIRGNVAFRKV